MSDMPSREYVFNAEYNTTYRLSGKCSAHAVQGKRFHCEQMAKVVVTICEGSENGVEHMLKLEVCEQHRRVIERSMDWRATHPLPARRLSPEAPHA